MNLIEYAKTSFNRGEVQKAAVVEYFARASAWLGLLHFETIAGNAYGYNVEGALPGVAFRGINESFTASTGIVNPATEALRIAGGDLKFDNFLMRTMGDARRAHEENMKAKALAAAVTTKLVKGDSTSDPREFDGLQARITGSQLFGADASATDGGDALSLAKLDEAIDAVPGANQIWLSKSLRRKFAVAARTSSLAGNINLEKDDFGRPQYTYAGLPLLVPYPENDGTEPLAYDETASTGPTATATSLYILNVGPGKVFGIQSAPMSVRRLGEMHDEPQQVTRVEWDIGLVIEHGRAAARVQGIADSAIVA